MEKTKKINSSLRHQDLPKYYRKVQAQTENAIKYGYYKLVPFHKAFEMVHGKMNEFYERKKYLKHEHKYILDKAPTVEAEVE